MDDQQINPDSRGSDEDQEVTSDEESDKEAVKTAWECFQASKEECILELCGIVLTRRGLDYLILLLKQHFGGESSVDEIAKTRSSNQNITSTKLQSGIRRPNQLSMTEFVIESDAIPAIEQLFDVLSPSLTSIHVSDTTLEGNGAGSAWKQGIQHCRSVENLYFSHVTFDDSFLGAFFQLFQECGNDDQNTISISKNQDLRQLHNTFTDLTMTCCDIRCQQLSLFSDAMTSSAALANSQLPLLYHLDLSGNNLSTESLPVLATLLNNQHQLHSLLLDYSEELFLECTSGNETGLQKFLQAIVTHIRLNQLSLNDCGVTDRVANALFRELATQPRNTKTSHDDRQTLCHGALSNLSLYDNNELTPSSSFISIIPEMQCLVSISLPFEFSEDVIHGTSGEGHKAFLSAIRANTSLQYLHYKGKTKPELAKTLSNIFHRNRSIKKVQQLDDEAGKIQLDSRFWPQILEFIGSAPKKEDCSVDGSSIFLFLQMRSDRLFSSQLRYRKDFRKRYRGKSV